MSKRWQVIGNAESDLTCSRFESQTFRFRDERVTAQPTVVILQIIVTVRQTNTGDIKKPRNLADYLKMHCNGGPVFYYSAH